MRFQREFGDFRNILLLSSICHDAAAPPFSHNGERLLEELTGMRHEQYMGRLLKNSAAEDVIKKYRHTLEEAAGIINGEGATGIVSASPSGEMEKICKRWKERIRLADSVSDRLKLAGTDVCVQAFRHKPERGVDNLYGPAAEASHENNRETIFDIKVFVNPKARIDEGKVRKITGELADMQ